ncbi:hypothetical protein LA6_005802 (plasmid) [Marinibacterium anthonyi]|nr:hypothetical protein LA6_005802 [Marinibacterium anthonyi]
MMLRILSLACIVASAAPAFAHRLDGYLQASVLSLGPERLTISLALTPGHEEAELLIAAADLDHDGTLSDEELHHHAETVVQDLALEIDGAPVRLTLQDVSAPDIAALIDGTAPLILHLSAAMPQSSGEHRLTYRNTYRSEHSTRLVNTEAPRGPFEVIAQERDGTQSVYSLVFRRRPGT